MTSSKREEFRIKVLEVLCEELNFDLNKTLVENNAIFELFPDIDQEDTLSTVLYLGEKGYLSYHIQRFMGECMPYNIKLQSKAIDLIGKIQRDMPIEKYEQDFSRNALSNFSNIYNSQIILNSPNSHAIYSSNEMSELLKYLDSLKNENMDNRALQKIVENIEGEIKNNTASKEFLRGIGSSMKNMGINLATNLLTSGIGKMLGI